MHRQGDESSAEAASEATPPGRPGEVPAPSPTPRARRLQRGLRSSWSFVARHGYLALVAGAVLVLTRTVEFEPPPEVRVGKPNVAQLVGEAPAQEFSSQLTNPQAVQVRSSLRLYPDNQMAVSVPDPAMDAQAKLLSQPVITTILGMNATIEQSIRLEGGDLDMDLRVDATPRLAHEAKRGQGLPPLVLETDIEVQSRRTPWWRGTPTERVHIDSHAFLNGVEENGYRLVFTVDQHLFSLDIELHRPMGASSTLANGNG